MTNDHGGQVSWSRRHRLVPLAVMTTIALLSGEAAVLAGSDDTRGRGLTVAELLDVEVPLVCGDAPTVRLVDGAFECPIPDPRGATNHYVRVIGLGADNPGPAQAVVGDLTGDGTNEGAILVLQHQGQAGKPLVFAYVYSSVGDRVAQVEGLPGEPSRIRIVDGILELEGREFGDCTACEPGPPFKARYQLAGTRLVAPGSEPVAAAAPARSDATVTATRATVDVRRKGKRRFSVVDDTQKVRNGDRIRTDSDGLARIEYGDGSYTRLDHDTTFVVKRITNNQGERQVRTTLLSGRTFTRVEKLTESESFVQRGGAATAAVVGTTFAVEVGRNPKTSTFTALEGRLTVRVTGEKPVRLRPSQQVEVVRGAPQRVRTLTQEQLCRQSFTCYGFVLAPDGLGVATFGEPREDVVATLTGILGEPDSTEEATPAGGIYSFYRWGHLRVVFHEGAIVGGMQARGFVEYVLARDVDFETGALEPWEPAPWENAARTPEGVGIGTERADADAAYPVTYNVSFLRDTCTGHVRHDGFSELDPLDFLLYVEPERQGLFFGPLIDDEVWKIGAHSDDHPGLFCFT